MFLSREERGLLMVEQEEKTRTREILDLQIRQAGRKLIDLGSSLLSGTTIAVEGIPSEITTAKPSELATTRVAWKDWPDKGQIVRWMEERREVDVRLVVIREQLGNG